MKFDEWVEENLGNYIDYDNVYGVQCVDLIKHYIKNVLEIEPQSIGNAIEYYNKRSKSVYLTSNFVWISNTPEFVPEKGDICVFTSKSGCGHVAVATGWGTARCFYSFDENFPSSNGEPMTLVKHTYSSFLGVLRPKNQNNIVSNIETKVYKKTTANLNAYSSKKFSPTAIVIPKGSCVELVSSNEGKMKKNGKSYKMCIIRYNTILYYVALDYLK